VRISVSNAGYTTFRGHVRVLATHSTRQFPLHFPSRASPCATTFRTQYTTIITAGAHTSAASSRLNWRPFRFKWTRPFRRKTKSGFCACAITFQTQSTSYVGAVVWWRLVQVGQKSVIHYFNLLYRSMLWGHGT